MIGVLKANTEEDIKLIKESCDTLSKFLVWEFYLIQKPQIIPTEARKKKDYKTQFDNLIITAKVDPDKFRDIVHRFDKLAESGKLPNPSELSAEAKAMHVKLDVLRASGETRADAAKWMSSRLVGKAAKHSAKSLGVEMSQYYLDDKKPTKKGGMFSGLFSTKSAGVFDANTAETTEGNRAERTIDRDKFKSDKLYRQMLEDDMKRIKKRGGLSDEETALVNEHNRLLDAQNGKDKKIATESDKILASMTAGEKAMYDITSIVGKGLFKAGKGIFNFATKSRKTKSPIETDVEPQVESIEDVEQSDKKEEVRPEVLDWIADFEKTTQKQIEPPEENSAIKEASYEKASEFNEKQLEAANKQIEISNKQLEILIKIDEDIKNIKIEGGNNDSPFPDIPDIPDRGSRNKSKSKLGKLAKLAKGAGIVGAVADVGFGVNDLLNGQTQEELPSGLEMLSPMKWGMYGGDKINKVAEMASGGKSIGSMAFDLFNSDDKDKAAKLDADVAAAAARGKAKKEARLKAEAEQIEGVKKETAPKLEEKQEKAETAKEEKSNESMAGAVSNVVNNSPNNSVVAPSAAPSKGRDNPRNPDNSLSQYLNSRVLKFT